MSNETSTIDSRKWWAVFIGLLTVEILLIFKVLMSEANTNLLIAIGLVAILLFLVINIENISNIVVGKEGFRAEMRSKIKEIKETVHKEAENVKEEVGEKVNLIDENINDIFFLTILDAYEYITLKKIRGDEKDDSYNFYPKAQDLLERLRNRGLIEEISDQSIFNDTNTRLIYLRNNFKLTERGNKFLDSIDKKGFGDELDKIVKRSGRTS